MVEVILMSFAAGGTAVWLVRNKMERDSDRAVALVLEGVLLGLDKGRDVGPLIRDLAKAFEESK